MTSGKRATQVSPGHRRLLSAADFEHDRDGTRLDSIEHARTDRPLLRNAADRERDRDAIPWR